MDKLIADQEAGKSVMVVIDDDMKRVCAELFKIEGGVAFVDIGWNQIGGCSFNPIHYVRGKVNGTTITEPSGRVFDFQAIPEQDDMMSEWLAWEIAKEQQGHPYDREHIKSIVLKDAIPDDVTND